MSPLVARIPRELKHQSARNIVYLHVPTLEVENRGDSATFSAIRYSSNIRFLNQSKAMHARAENCSASNCQMLLVVQA